MTDTAVAESFEAFEKRRWGETAAAYDRHYPALLDQAIEPLLDRASVGAGTDCLDLACGPGTLAARAAQRGARVVGVDFAPAMIECARSRFPRLTFRVGDAAQLDLPAASMDVVAMNFGLMHMARPEAVAASVAHVLRPQGHFVFTVWAEPQNSVAAQIIEAAMSLADTPAALPAGQPFYRFCSIDENRRLLGAAGFDTTTIAIEDVPLVWRFDAADDLYLLFERVTTRSSLVIAAQSPETRARIRAAFASGVARWPSPGGGYAVPHRATLVSAMYRG
jgi:SAM-dependent methyltransferase